MDKEDVAHIYNGKYSAIKRNEIELSVMRWMDLESIIQSEVSQKEKNKCRTLHIFMESKKKKKVELGSTLNLVAGQE